MDNKQVKDSHILNNFKSVSTEVLLNRAPSEIQIDHWTNQFAQKIETEVSEGTSVIIFQLNDEWFAFATKVFSQILSHKIIHRIPHDQTKLLLGIINLEGRLTLCVNLESLLGIEKKEQKIVSIRPMLAIEQDKHLWIFPVDEVVDISLCLNKDLTNTPVTLSKSSKNYIKGVFSWKNRTVGFLDEDLIFASLIRKFL